MPEPWRVVPGADAVPLERLSEVATSLIALAGPLRVWFFYGEMGSGKTTLIKEIGRKLGVMEVMSSPTFAIMNEHDTRQGHVFHADLYRMGSEKEILDLGLDEYFESGEYCLVEWPERMGDLRTPPHFNVRITPVDKLHRKIEYQPV